MYYRGEVDDNIVSSKDLNNTSVPDTSLLHSLIEEGQENQEEVIQCNQSEYEEMPQLIGDFILEEIISRYGAKNNYNIINEQQVEMLSRANELSLRVSADLLQKVDDLANRAMAIIDMFGRVYEVAKQEGYPIDGIVEDKEKLREFLGI